MSKGVFLCVGTGGHVLPAYNVIKSMLNQGLDKKNILVVTDERGVEYFKDKDIEIIVYPFVSSQKGIGAYLLKLIKMLKSIIFLYKSLKKHKPQFLFTTGAYIAPISAIVSKLLNVNFYIQEQNVYSGLGNKIAKSDIAQIKVAVPKMALSVIDKAIQIHGGGGVSQDTPLARMYAGMRTLRLADGPDEVHRRTVARIELSKHQAAQANVEDIKSKSAQG